MGGVHICCIDIHTSVKCMSPTLVGSSVIWCFEHGNVIEKCDGKTFPFLHCHIIGRDTFLFCYCKSLSYMSNSSIADFRVMNCCPHELTGRQVL